MWDWKVGTPLHQIAAAQTGSIGCLASSPDGREILSGGEDGTVRLHDAATGEERLAFYGHTTPVVDVDISADGFTKVWDRQLSSAAALLPKRPEK